MDSVIRGLLVYAFLLIVFRLCGNRTLAQTTSFDLVLLLIISETTQQAMMNNDPSITNAFLLILTLVGSSIALSLVKQRYPTLEKWLEGTPLVIVEDGVPNRERMDKSRVDEMDILSAARASAGLKEMSEIRYAILERNGEITIIPK